MDRVTLDLSDLEIHRLSVDRREHGNAIEFQLHATIEGLDEGAIRTIAGKELTPEEVVVSVRTSEETDEGDLTRGS